MEDLVPLRKHKQRNNTKRPTPDPLPEDNTGSCLEDWKWLIDSEEVSSSTPLDNINESEAEYFPPPDGVSHWTRFACGSASDSEDEGKETPKFYCSSNRGDYGETNTIESLVEGLNNLCLNDKRKHLYDIIANQEEPGSVLKSDTLSPTITPTVSPTVSPTVTPTVSPTVTPTVTPTATPTGCPTASPTVTPNVSSVVSPTVPPSSSPSSPSSLPFPSPPTSTCSSKQNSNSGIANPAWGDLCEKFAEIYQGKKGKRNAKIISNANISNTITISEALTTPNVNASTSEASTIPTVDNDTSSETFLISFDDVRISEPSTALDAFTYNSGTLTTPDINVSTSETTTTPTIDSGISSEAILVSIDDTSIPEASTLVAITSTSESLPAPINNVNISEAPGSSVVNLTLSEMLLGPMALTSIPEAPIVPTVNISLSEAPVAQNVDINFTEMVQTRYTYTNEEMREVRRWVRDIPMSRDIQQGLYRFRSRYHNWRM